MAIITSSGVRSPKAEELHLPRHREVRLVPADLVDDSRPHVPVDDPRPPYRLPEVLDVLRPVMGVDDPAVTEVPRDVEHRDVAGPNPVTRRLAGILPAVLEVL